MAGGKTERLYGFWLASTFLSLCHPTVGTTAEDMECFSKWAQLSFDYTNWEGYSTYFAEDSFIHLAAAGKYVGPVDIEEYVKFATPVSELIEDQTEIASSSGYWGIQEGLCSFYLFRISDGTLSSLGGGAVLSGTNSMMRFNFDANTSKIMEWYVYYETTFLVQFFESLDTNEMAEYFCDIMEGNCSDTWDFNNFTTQQECLDAYGQLPLTSANTAIDGKSKGCRILHGTFAKYNSDHCPHLSIAPLADSKGREKCQYSQGLAVDAHFTAEQIGALNAWVASQQSTAPSTTPPRFVNSYSPLRPGFALFALVVGFLSLANR